MSPEVSVLYVCASLIFMALSGFNFWLGARPKCSDPGFSYMAGFVFMALSFINLGIAFGVTNR